MVYFISDVHLRLDRPERAERLARFVHKLNDNDALYIVGDLCDFWMASREVRPHWRDCPGLKALARYRQAGGKLTIFRGNHDAWLTAFYREELGASCVPSPLCGDIEGIRVHVLHGHEIQSRIDWKHAMESQAFFHAFSRLPAGAARLLARLRDADSDGARSARNARLKKVFRRYAAAADKTAGLFVFGHVHERVDEQLGARRLVVLGDWCKQTSYLSLCAGNADLICEP